MQFLEERINDKDAEIKNKENSPPRNDKYAVSSIHVTCSKFCSCIVVMEFGIWSGLKNTTSQQFFVEMTKRLLKEINGSVQWLQR